MIEILLTSLIIALFCTSWDILLSYEPGEPKRNQMLLYWFRKEIEEYILRIKNGFQEKRREIEKDFKGDDDSTKWSSTCIEHRMNRKSELISQSYLEEEKKLDKLFYLKPILLCKYCFPSFYGTIIFIMLHGFNLHLWKEWLLSIVCSVILVGIISGIHEKLK